MNKSIQELVKVAGTMAAVIIFCSLAFVLLLSMGDVISEFFIYILLWNATGYFVINRLFAKDTGSVRIFFVISILVLMNFLFFSILGYHMSHFNSVIWKNHESVRYYMIDNIEKDIELLKMSESQVVQLLGEPNNSNNNKWVYEIGNRGFEQTYYVIEFSENRTVIDANETEDWN